MIEEPPKITIARQLRRPTAAQIAAFQGVPTGFVADAMDSTGALGSAIAPVGGGRDVRCVAAGPALTADCGPADVLATFVALHCLKPGDMLMVAFGGYQGCAAVGDRIAGMIKNGGGAGLVTDGPVRDYEGIVAVGLPIWCTGLCPASPYAAGPGRVGVPVALGGRTVATGDMVVADRDGVVVVPFDAIDQVAARLADIAKREAALDAEVAAGRTEFDHVAQMLNSGSVCYVD